MPFSSTSRADRTLCVYHCGRVWKGALASTQAWNNCNDGGKGQWNAAQVFALRLWKMQYGELADFEPDVWMQVIETEPYEAMGKALVSWTREHIDSCDVIHAHEWGGLLVDLATLDNYRQLKPGKLQYFTAMMQITARCQHVPPVDFDPDIAAYIQHIS